MVKVHMDDISTGKLPQLAPDRSNPAQESTGRGAVVLEGFVDAVTVHPLGEGTSDVRSPTASIILAFRLEVVELEDAIGQRMVDLVSPVTRHGLLEHDYATFDGQRIEVVRRRVAASAEALDETDHVRKETEIRRIFRPLEDESPTVGCSGEQRADVTSASASVKSERQAMTLMDFAEHLVGGHMTKSFANPIPPLNLLSAE